mgnify:CR=1 FL=1
MSRKYIARCEYFCSVGKKENRGVVEARQKVEEETDSREVVTGYKCGVGKNDCAVLKLYNLLMDIQSDVKGLDLRTIMSQRIG